MSDCVCVYQTNSTLFIFFNSVPSAIGCCCYCMCCVCVWVCETTIYSYLKMQCNLIILYHIHLHSIHKFFLLFSICIESDLWFAHRFTKCILQCFRNACALDQALYHCCHCLVDLQIFQCSMTVLYSFSIIS